jgi:Rieske Fe-S protein
LNKNSQKVTVKKVNLKSVKRSRKGSIKVSWAKVSDASGYELQYSTSSKFKGAKTKKISKAKTTYTLKKLKSGKIYRVRIRAYKIAEGKKVYGSYSKVRKVRVK